MKRALKKAFIPHQENDFRPHVLRPKTLIPIIVALVVMQAAFFWATTNVIPRSRLFGVVTVNTLIDGTNAARTTNNIAPLQVNPLLQAAAQEKANDMVANGYFAHTSPTGVTPWHWFNAVGYAYTYAGENLAVNFSNSEDVTNAWLNSPTHRENIMNRNFTQIGIAVAQGTFNGQPATYVVEEFGTPIEATAPIAYANPPAPQKAPTEAIAKATPPASPKTQEAAITQPASTTAETEPATIAIKGAETTNQQQTQSPAGIATIPPITTQAAPQSNVAQRLFANPGRTLNDIYLLTLVFFIFALGLNVFIKIRVQHPDLIFGGLVAICLVGFFFLINQHIFLQTLVK